MKNEAKQEDGTVREGCHFRLGGKGRLFLADP